MMAKNTIVIGQFSEAHGDNTLVVGDHIFTTRNGDVVVGDKIFDKPIPEKVQEMIKSNGPEVFWLLHVAFFNRAPSDIDGHFQGGNRTCEENG